MAAFARGFLAGERERLGIGEDVGYHFLSPLKQVGPSPMGMQDYVEAVVKDGFRHELEQDENVIRSLPFFATSLGLLATVLSVTRADLCLPDRGPFSLALGIVLGLLGLSVTATLVFLFRAISPRRFAYPMQGTDFVAYAAGVVEAYRAGQEDGGDEAVPLEKLALAEVRATRIQQLAEATEVNRRNNLARNGARAVALTALLAAITSAFLLFATIVARETLVPGACHVGAQESRTTQPAGGGDGSRVAAGAAAAHPADTRGGAGRVGVSRGRQP